MDAAMTVRDLIREAVKRPTGMAVADIPRPQKAVGSACSYMVGRGEIFVAKVSHKVVRYFDTPDRADAYVAVTQKPKPKYGPAPGKPGWGRDDPVHITSETRVTICPSPPRALKTNTYNVW